MRILMSGGSGLIGTAVGSRLEADGHTVVRLVRRPPKAGELTWDPVAGTLDPAAFDGCDAVINLSGANIGDKRWTDQYKAELVSSRLLATELLANTMADLDRKPEVFLSGSAVGWYGDRGDERLDELSAPERRLPQRPLPAVGGGDRGGREGLYSHGSLCERASFCRQRAGR